MYDKQMKPNVPNIIQDVIIYILLKYGSGSTQVTLKMVA